MAVFPSFTATTERGCILLMQPLHISLNITSTRTTLSEPDVEEAHPPTNISATRIIWHVEGHVI